MVTSVLTDTSKNTGEDMDADEFKQRYPKYFVPQYTHFDRKMKLDDAFSYVTNSENIKKHKFFPFISYTKKIVKFSKDKGQYTKERVLCYAAHMDSLIYKYYGILLNDKLSEFLDKNSLNYCAIAYRSNLKGESNIHFSKRAFDFIKKQEKAYVFIGDFKDFFPSLDHMYLKKRLCNLLGVEQLSEDYYAVFKNVTRFSMIELEELLAINNLPNNLAGKHKFNKLKTALPDNETLNSLKKKCIHVNRNLENGIPQGSPISGVLANIYMMEFDLAMKHLIEEKNNGLYMRYSDDIIIVLPNIEEGVFKKIYDSIINEINAIPNLILEDKKKNIFYYEHQKVLNINNGYLEKTDKNSNIINYLVFSFDGVNVTIRQKTQAKYYCRAYGKIKTIKRNSFMTKNNNKVSKKELYRNYSERHGNAGNSNGNYIDYVKRAESVYEGEKKIANIRKRHMSKIALRLKKKQSKQRQEIRMYAKMYHIN